MRAKVIGFVLVTALPSACSPSVIRDFPNTLFNTGEYSAQASRRAVPVVVLGSAAGLDGARLSDAVVAQMQGADWAPHARFAPAPAPDSNDVYSYILLFNGPHDVTSSDLCARRSAAPPTVAARADTGVVLVAGLCRYDKVASGVTGRAAGIAGPDSADFRNLIVAVVQELTQPAAGFQSGGGMGDDKGGRS
jgi:hypothetical protein